jgi:hypothetical protein
MESSAPPISPHVRPRPVGEDLVKIADESPAQIAKKPVKTLFSAPTC